MLRRIFGSGATVMFRGARRGQAVVSAFGAALMIVGWLRNRRDPGKHLVYSRTLEDGEAVTVRLLRGDAAAATLDIEA
ncbi:MAG TPA: hypothetical protein VGC11_10100 [Acidimicrobiia bacterium]